MQRRKLSSSQHGPGNRTHFSPVYSSTRHRGKEERWGGTTLGSAFKYHLDYRIRLPAQRKFYKRVKAVQRTVARHLGAPVDSGFQPKIKPQLAPCYTNYPATLAANAAIGLTGFLEYKARLDATNLLNSHLESYLKDPAAADEVRVSPEAYRKVAVIVVEAVETRLVLEDLQRSLSSNEIEIYRLFACNQMDLRLRSVRGIVHAVILYGDVLPVITPELQPGGRPLHPMSISMVQDVEGASQSFLRRLVNETPDSLLEFGAEWVRAVCISLVDYLPDANPVNENPAMVPVSDQQSLGYKYREVQPEPATTDRLPPLETPMPPVLFDEGLSAAQQIAQSLGPSLSGAGADAGEETAEQHPLTKALSGLIETFEKASHQPSWQDMRSDLVEQALSNSDFTAGPIEGSETSGHEISVDLGGNEQAGGEIFDRSLELSDDVPAYEALLAESYPLVQTLKRSLYPNLEQVPETERFHTGGALDPVRLALADIKETVFKRHRVYSRPDRRGRPLLLIACDASGSLSSRQINMLQRLAAGWLQSTVKTRIEVMAGIYHSGQIRRGLTGPLVQWLFHPQKTPATGRKDAARALLSLPDSGTGVQSDALSLEFMLGEARRNARGRTIYVIIISDCAWNVSFNMGKSGQEEVAAVLETAYDRLSDRLHVTLVALGVERETGFEDLVDNVIRVSDAELDDVNAVATGIGSYVASCMRERQKLMAKTLS